MKKTKASDKPKVTKIYGVLDYDKLYEQGKKGNPFDLCLGWSTDEEIAELYAEKVIQTEEYKDQVVHPLALEYFQKRKSKTEVEELKLVRIGDDVYLKSEADSLFGGD